MKLDKRDFQTLRLIKHFQRNGVSCFKEMGGGKALGYDWDISEFLQSQGLTIVNEDSLTVRLSDKGEKVIKDHLEVYKNSENIVPISQNFLQVCLQNHQVNCWFNFQAVPKSYLENYHNAEDEIFILVSLHGMNCIEIEGIYPDIKLCITEKGARLSQKELGL